MRLDVLMKMKKMEPRPHAQTKRGVKGFYVIPFLLLFIGIMSSKMIHDVLRNQGNESVREQFSIDAGNQIALLRETVNGELLALSALASFFDASEKVTREEFSIFSGSLRDNFPGISAISFIQVVPDKNRKKFEAQIAQDAPGFMLHETGRNNDKRPATRRDTYYPLIYLEPIGDKHDMIGFDFNSIIDHVEAIEQAIFTGQTAVSVDDGRSRRATNKNFSLFKALYNHPESTEPESTEPGAAEPGSAENVMGLVAAHIDFASHVGKGVHERMEIHMVEIKDQASVPEGVSSQIVFNGDMYPMSYSDLYDMGGKKWQFLALPNSNYYKLNESMLPLGVALLGGCMTVLLCYYILLLIDRKKNIEQEVDRQIVIVQNTMKYLRDLLDHIPDPVFVKDQQRRWIDGNKATWNLVGAKPEELIGKEDKDIFTLKEASQALASDAEVFKTGAVTVDEQMLTDRLGEAHTLSIKKALFKNEKGETVLVGVGRDVTHEKEMEKRVEKYMQQLEVSNKELNNFAYIISHDLKEPLRGIHNHSLFMLEDYGDQLDQAGKDRLNRMITLTDRMDQLISEVLNYSRLGQTDLNIEQVPVKEIIDDVTETLHDMIERHHATVTVQQDIPPIFCDRIKMTTVFRNLINNAIKYNDQKECQVNIGYERQKMYNNKTYRDVYYVKDNGIGIREEDLNTIFNMFKRLNSGDKYGQGSGAGLAFVKKIIQRHDGIIWAESEPDKGTIFYISLGASGA